MAGAERNLPALVCRYRGGCSKVRGQGDAGDAGQPAQAAALAVRAIVQVMAARVMRGLRAFGHERRARAEMSVHAAMALGHGPGKSLDHRSDRENQSEECG